MRKHWTNSEYGTSDRTTELFPSNNTNITEGSKKKKRQPGEYSKLEENKFQFRSCQKLEVE